MKDKLKKIALGFALLAIHFAAAPGYLQFINQLGLVIFLLYLFLDLIWLKQLHWSWHGLGFPLGILFLAVLFSSFDAYIPTQALAEVANYAGLILLFFLLVSFISKKEDREYLLKFLFWGYMLILLAGLFQYFLSFIEINVPILRILTDEARGLPRVSSLFIVRSGTNAYAAYLALFLPIMFSYVYENYKQKKVSTLFLIFFITLNLFNVFVSLSRALLLSLLLLLIWLALKSKYSKKILLTLFFFLILSFVLIFPFRLTITSFVNSQDSSNYYHLVTSLHSFSLISQHPFNGWGGGHMKMKLKRTETGWENVTNKYKTEAEKKKFYFGRFEDELAEAKQAGVIVLHSPHNYYLSLLLEQGLIGLLAFLYLIFVLFKKINNNKDFIRLGLNYGLVSFLIYCLFQDSLKTTIISLFFCLFMVIVVTGEKSSGEYR